MALADNRKMSILIGGFFLVGLMMGLFFARLSQSGSTKSESLTFSTQSVGNEAVSVTQVHISCPWVDNLLGENDVYIGNPLVDKAFPLLSLQQGLTSENFTLLGPIASENSTSWKATLQRQRVDTIEAIWDGATAVCQYSVGDTILFSLEQPMIDKQCEAENTSTDIGFLCDD